ncbi:hypothetical protein LWI28_026873 [Acer negundo]|uniref:Pre-nudix hydrolase domain-containing protein n=1 Tax=Acer negundo TaxID=4023 RepID=A0AAD5IXY6_ACENE|nr:hypothetical protein LWI28_026873 [Acer negundo]
MSTSIEKEMVLPENEVENIELLSSIEDAHGGVTVEMKKHMDSKKFASMLGSSLLYWIQQKKRGVWIKLPIEFSNLVEPAVKEGFRYHHAESDYLMLVKWIPETFDTLPANASHRVGIGAFVMNDKGELSLFKLFGQMVLPDIVSVLVVRDRNGRFKGTNVWKLPTGTIDEVRIFVQPQSEKLKKRQEQSHQSFFRKSDLFFVFVAFSPSELEIVDVGSSNSNIVKTIDATKAFNMISFNMNDDASTRQHTSPIILHNSTPILNSNTGPMESDLQD